MPRKKREDLDEIRKGISCIHIMIDEDLADELLELGGCKLAGFYVALERHGLEEGRSADFFAGACEKYGVSRQEFKEYVDLLAARDIVRISAPTQAGEGRGCGDRHKQPTYR